jgi:hypothetical protein
MVTGHGIERKEVNMADAVGNSQEVGRTAGAVVGFLSGVKVGAVFPIPLVGSFVGGVVGAMIGSGLGAPLGQSVAVGSKAIARSVTNLTSSTAVPTAVGATPPE